MRKAVYLVLAITILFVLSACTASQSEESESSASTPAAPVVESAAESNVDNSSENSKDSKDQSGQQVGEQETQGEMPDQSEEMTADTSEEGAMGVDRPAWQQLALTNARTGESFTLADFEGQTVFVEPMATWCSNCRRQLGNVRDARQQLVGDEVVFVALSVETNIDDVTLANYADGAGFDWLFAVVTPELLGELADEFGRAITNPPATPHFIIRPDGTSTELVTGIEPAGQIVSQITAAQS